jgi:hypothetical protein
MSTFELIRYLLSESKIKIDRKAEFLDAADLLMKKTGSYLSDQKTREEFLSCGLDLLRLKPQQYLRDRIRDADRMTLTLTSKDELKESYEYYSQKCFFPDSITISLKLPETFIEIARRLIPADTSSRKTISMDLASLSWPLLQNGCFKTSMDALTLALKADSTNEFIYETLPLALLLNDRTDEAFRTYLKYYKRSYLNTFQGFFGPNYLKDIDDLEKRGIKHPGFKKVREMIIN